MGRLEAVAVVRDVDVSCTSTLLVISDWDCHDLWIRHEKSWATKSDGIMTKPKTGDIRPSPESLYQSLYIGNISST